MATNQPTDEEAIRSWARQHGGKIVKNAKYIEVTFPGDKEDESLAGRVFRAGDWHNLRVVALKQGRFIFS